MVLIIWNIAAKVFWAIFDAGGTSSTQDLREYNEAAKKTATPVSQPKPYVPDRKGEEITIPTYDPPDNLYKPPTPPPTIKAEPVDYQVVEAGVLPDIWQWYFESTWLGRQIRKLFPQINPTPETNSTFRYGRLLTGNTDPATVAVAQLGNMVAIEEMVNHHQESYDAYTDWLAAAKGFPPETQRGDFYDQGAILWPMDTRNYSDGVTLLYGSRFLADIFANFWSRSLNYDACTTRGVIYSEIDIQLVQPEFTHNWLEDTAEVDSDASGNSADEAGLAYSLMNAIYNYRQSVAADGETVEKQRVVLETGGIGGSGNLDKILAVKDFPFKVPVSLLLEPADLEGLSEEEIEEKAYEKIESIPQLILWLTRALDELIGKFPVTMEIGETDLLDLNDEYAAWKADKDAQNVDKSLPFYLQNDKLVSFREEDGRIIKTVKVPNLAEGMAELLGNNIAEGQRNGLALEFLSRTLFEIGSTKNTAINANAWIEAIADYLGFATVDKVRDIDYTYNPVIDKEKQGESIIKMLEPTQVMVALPEYEDKQSLESHMAIMREMHGIVKAALTEGIGNTDGQLLQRMKDFAAELGITAFDKANPLVNDDGTPPEKDEFDQLLEQIERGFIDQPGITDTTNPYGREYEKRPRIRRLTNDTPGD